MGLVSSSTLLCWKSGLSWEVYMGGLEALLCTGYKVSRESVRRNLEVIISDTFLNLFLVGSQDKLSSINE